MAAKKLLFLKKLGKGLLLLITILAAGALFFSFLAKITRPTFSHVIAYCGLFFYYILLVTDIGCHRNNMSMRLLDI